MNKELCIKVGKWNNSLLRCTVRKTSNYFVMKLYMFRTFPLSFIRSLFTVHSTMVHVIQLSSRTRMELQFQSWSCSKAVYKPVWHTPLLSVQRINSWWRTDELSETRRVSWQNKFVKLVHLVGFITKKFVAMHGHMNLKLTTMFGKAVTFVRIADLFEDVTVSQLVETLSHFFKSLKFFTISCHLSLSWARWAQFSSLPLNHPSEISPFGVSQITLQMHFSVTSPRCSSSPSHHRWLVNWVLSGLLCSVWW
jgi:hypothetical protein